MSMHIDCDENVSYSFETLQIILCQWEAQYCGLTSSTPTGDLHDFQVTIQQKIRLCDLSLTCKQIT